MKDWIEKLHAFLTLNDREILEHSGKISHEQAEQFALDEYEKFRTKIIKNEIDEFDKAIKKLKEKK